MQRNKVTEFGKKLTEMKPVDKTNLIFDLLRRTRSKNNFGKREFMFLGQKVCQNAFLAITRTSKSYINRLLTAIDGGAVTAPQDGRAGRARESPATSSAMNFFSYVYHHLGEPLAETVLHDSDCDDEADPEEPEVPKEPEDPKEEPVDDFNEYVLQDHAAAGVGVASIDLEVRWIPHCSLADLYAQYAYAWITPGETPCSQSVFNKTYKRSWRGTIRVRRLSQHSQCNDCANYKQWRLTSKSEEEKVKVQKAYQKHLGSVFADRDLAGRYIKHAEVSSREGTPLPFSKRTLMISLDGMDQAGEVETFFSDVSLIILEPA